MINKIFKLHEHHTTIKQEMIAGLTTFLAMAYILGVNPVILQTSGMDMHSVFMATALSAGIACILMGIFANYPVGLASGMGVNAFFAYTVVGEMGFSWQAALSAVFVSGIIFILISITGIRKRIINAIPIPLKIAIGAGIGFFIAFVGLKNAGIIIANSATAVGIGNLNSPEVMLALFGIVITLFLRIKKVPAAVFIGMIISTIVGLIANVMGVSVLNAEGFELLPTLPSSLISVDFSMHTFGAFALGFEELFANTSTALLAIFSFLFVDFFDTAGTLVAIGNRIGLVKENGELENIEKALLADSFGSVVGAVLGTSTVTSFVESASGVEAGGRTGLTAITTGLLFLLSIFISPIVLACAVNAITAPALVVVGILMAQQIGNINWDDMILASASFITILMMILTYSISHGLAFGFITYVLCMVAANKGKQVSYIVWILVLLFIIYFGWLM